MTSVEIDSYRNKDVWATKPDWAAAPDQELENQYDIFQGIGPSRVDMDVEFAIEGFKFGYQFWSKAGIQDMMDFFDGKLGRYGHFWMPSWRQDVVVNTPIDAADTSLAIEDIKYDDYWLPNAVDGRFLALIFPDDEIVYRKVISTAGGGTVLNLDGPVGKDCPAGELGMLMVCFLYLVRFDADELEMRYESDSVASCELSFKSVGTEMTTTTTSTTTTTTSTTTSSSTTSTCTTTTGTFTTSSSHSTTTTNTQSSTTTTTATTSTTLTGSTTTTTAPDISKLAASDGMYLLPDTAPYTGTTLNTGDAQSAKVVDEVTDEWVVNNGWSTHEAWGVDLGSSKSVSKLRCYGTSAAGVTEAWYGANYDSMKVLKSDDNANWTLVEQFDAPSILGSGSGTQNWVYWDLVFSGGPQSARYWKVVCVDTNLAVSTGATLRPAEIEAYG